MPELQDYTRDLRALAEMASQPNQLETVLHHALAALREVVPYDLAAVLALHDEELIVQVAEGPLANERVRRHRLRLSDFPTIKRALGALMNESWPGNVRELVNALERATILQAQVVIDATHLALNGATPGATAARDERPSAKMLPLREHERRYLAQALRHTNGKIYGTDGAAALLGLKPTTLQSKLKKHGLKS